jgi:hypothetical protein
MDEIPLANLSLQEGAKRVQMCFQTSENATSGGLSMSDMYGLAALYLQHRRLRDGQIVWNADDAMWFMPDGPTARAWRALTGVFRGFGSRRRPTTPLSEPMARC